MRGLLQRLTVPMVAVYAALGLLVVVLLALRPLSPPASGGGAAGGLDLGILAVPDPDYAGAVSRLRANGFFLRDDAAAQAAGQAAARDRDDVPTFATVVREKGGQTYAIVRGKGAMQRLQVGETFGSFTLISLDSVKAEFQDESGDIVTVKLYSSS